MVRRERYHQVARIPQPCPLAGAKIGYQCLVQQLARSRTHDTDA